jgi:hypothetical protein
MHLCSFYYLLHSHLGISDEYLPWHAGNGTYISPLLVAVVGLSCCFEGQPCVWNYWLRRTNVAEHIVGCLERRANVGRSLLEDSPFDHCPVDRPCRPAGQGTDLELGHLLERSR